MAPSWSFKLLDPVASAPLPATTVNSTPLQLVTQKSTDSSPPRRAEGRASHVVSSKVGRRKPINILDLPVEVRQVIWHAIYYDIQLDTENRSYKPPTTPWDGLQLTCHLICDEIADFWPRTIVTQSKIDSFIAKPLGTSIGRLMTLRRLSLEVPFNMSHEYYGDLALCVAKFSVCLKDLRIFFAGHDQHGVKSFVHGCTDQTRRPPYSQKLPITGQSHANRQPLFTMLFFMTNLRSLVIKNANYPLLQGMLIKDKPQLEYLHISADPRSIAHTEHKLEGRGEKLLMLPPRDNLPPVKVLHISTNSAITSYGIATKVAPTLEELNWTVTDPSLQFRQYRWLEETGNLFQDLSQRARCLRTMRICILFEIRELHPAYGAFMAGINLHLPQFAALEILEVHIDAGSPYLGQELIKALPNSLKRLYISDKLITPQKLEIEINKRYFTSDTCKSLKDQCSDAWCWAAPRADLPQDLPQQKATFPLQDDRHGPRLAHETPSAWFPAVTCHYEVRPFFEDPAQDRSNIEGSSGGSRGGRGGRGRGKGGRKRHGRNGERARSNQPFIMTMGEVCVQHSPVGEPYAALRKDYISMRSGNLGFVNYEYNASEATRMALLRINGRLLDRERNLGHLALYDGGKFISPRTIKKGSVQDYTETESPLEGREDWEDESEVDRIKGLDDSVLNELDELADILKKTEADSPHQGYFGMEKQAMELFSREAVAEPSELRERSWVQEVAVGTKEHWHSECCSDTYPRVEEITEEAGNGTEDGGGSTDDGESNEHRPTDQTSAPALEWVQEWLTVNELEMLPQLTTGLELLPRPATILEHT